MPRSPTSRPTLARSGEADGTATAPQAETARGLIGGAFTHFTSRAADPQVHTHLVIANMAEGSDGRFSALHGSVLFEHRRAAGYVYQAVLRHELHERLGVDFEPVVKGSADVAGIPKGARRMFSKRRAAIEAELAAVGASGERASQTASLKTRQAKDDTLRLADLRPGWADEAGRRGVDLRNLPAAGSVPGLPTVDEIAVEVVADRATFTFPDAIAATAAARLARSDTRRHRTTGRGVPRIASGRTARRDPMDDGRDPRTRTIRHRHRPPTPPVRQRRRRRAHDP